jgi:putrescine aminotransferase
MSAPPVDSQAVLATMRRHVSRGRASLAELTGGYVEVSSRGATVIDADGRRFLDCGGYGVFILGHCHPRVVAAVREQLERHPLATRLLAEPRLAQAAAALAARAPAGLEYAHFVNSGAEATETAIKMARTKGKRNLVTMRGGFHGKTMGALSVTPQEAYQAPFRPLLPHVTEVPFGDAHALDVVLGSIDDCCVILEPVQAEAGVICPPDGYLRDVEAVCRGHRAFFVLDEIQTGLGRLGSWWGADIEGIVPDVLLVGKGLSGGVVPVAAALASPEAYSVLDRDPFLHTSTFAGSPLATAAAHAALTVIEEEDIVARSRELGRRLLEEIAAIDSFATGGPVTEVRGRGLLIGIEFAQPHHAAGLVLELLDRRVIVNSALNNQHVVRLTPPAVMDAADVQHLLHALRESAKAVEQTFREEARSSCAP